MIDKTQRRCIHQPKFQIITHVSQLLAKVPSIGLRTRTSQIQKETKSQNE
jgi:hypothetical protein